jgi:polyphosphate kinase 2 (PPK2 family)
LPYQKDISALKHRSLVIVGAEDEANDPSQYPNVMQDLNPHQFSIKRLKSPE